MKGPAVKSILVFLEWGMLTSAKADSCPLSPNYIEPTINVKFSSGVDGETDFLYSVKNGKQALWRIEYLAFVIGGSVTARKMPQGWMYLSNSDRNEARVSFVTVEPDPDDPAPDNFQTLPAPYAIKPGEEISGFGFRATLSPGLIKFRALGDTIEDPVSDSGELPDCPGWHFNDPAPKFDTYPTGVTIGPVGDKYLSASIELRHEKMAGQVPDIAPTSIGKIQVVLKSNDQFDASQVDIFSVRFGYGKAPVLSHKLIGMEGRKEGWDKALFPIDAGKKKGHTKDLLLEFDLVKVGVRCNIDLALFLTGKINGKDFLGGAPIKQQICELPKPKAKK